MRFIPKYLKSLVVSWRIFYFSQLGFWVHHHVVPEFVPLTADGTFASNTDLHENHALVLPPRHEVVHLVAFHGVVLLLHPIRPRLGGEFGSDVVGVASRVIRTGLAIISTVFCIFYFEHRSRGAFAPLVRVSEIPVQRTSVKAQRRTLAHLHRPPRQSTRPRTQHPYPRQWREGTPQDHP